MAKAYIKIDVAPGKEKIVRSALAQTTGVKEAHITTGQQDIMAMIEADTYEKLLKMVLTKLRLIDGVLKTDTNLILE